MQELPDKPYFSPKELSFILGKDVKTIYGWTYQGRVEVKKIVGSVYITRDSVVQLIGDNNDDFSVKVF